MVSDRTNAGPACPSVVEEMGSTKQASDVHAVAHASLARWGMSPEVQLKLISHSENAVFLIARPDGWRKVLRVHRTGYHSVNAVRSELAWMTALQRDAGVETPQAVAGLDGELIQHVQAAPQSEPQMVVLFDFIAGAEPKPKDLSEAFQHLGSIAAQMHRHARSWTRPPFFERLVWDFDHSIGMSPNWGSWQSGFASSVAGFSVIRQAEDVIRVRLERFGKSAARFGLIHSDLRLANLLVDGGRTKVIDFDDCGFGWFLYDLASSMTFLENHPDIEQMIAAWIAGYQQVDALSADEVAEIPTFMMLRRLVLMGWAGSHPDTDLAREMGLEYSIGTVEFARKFLGKLGNA